MQELHLICNAHIDPVWHWQLDEGIGCALSTFRVAAELAEDDRYPAFVFNHNEALLYERIEQLDPALFRRIQALVAAGKWHIMGGWYLQPDCNKLCGESFFRQIRRGRQYFQKKFGVRPTTAVNFDSFGHTKGLVQILNKCGYDSYIFCRPNCRADNADPPAPTFIWQGFAGSEVIAANQFPYNSPFGQAESTVRDYITAHQSDEPPTHFLLWGVGNHGGGPSRQDLTDLSALLPQYAGIRVLHSTPEHYIQQLRASGCALPAYTASLDKVMVGCYTSQARVKQAHRQLENALKTAETMATHASLASSCPYPHARLAKAEECLMLSQFHDILPGSTSMAAMESALRTLQHGLDIAEEVRVASFFALSSGQPRGERYVLPLLVYNPLPYEDEFEIENEFTLADQNYTAQFNQVTVMQGATVLPSQLEQDTSNIPIDWRKKIVFRAALKPMTMNRFDLAVTLIDKKPARPLCNERYFTVCSPRRTVSIDAQTGLIHQYTVDGTAYLQPGAGRLCVLQDNHDPWGMTVSSFSDVIGSFRLATPSETARICSVEQEELAPVRIIEDGPIRTVIEAVFCYETSHAIVRYGISKHTEEITVRIQLFSQLKHAMVKYCLPTCFAAPRIEGKTAFGRELLRTDGTETISQEYLLATEHGKTLSVIKQGVYGSDSTGGEIRLSLIRAANYCSHPVEGQPYSCPQDRFNDCLDSGETRFTFVINASETTRREQAIEKEATAVGQPPQTLCFFPSGEGAVPHSLCRLDNPSVAVERLAENQAGALVLHLFNSAASHQNTTVFLDEQELSFSVALKPFEIGTYLITPAGTVTKSAPDTD